MKSEIQQLQESHKNIENKIDQIRNDISTKLIEKWEIQEIKQILHQSKNFFENSKINYSKTSQKTSYKPYTNLEDNYLEYQTNTIAEPAANYTPIKKGIYTNGLAFTFLISIIALGFLIDIYGLSSTYLIIGFITTFVLFQSIIVAFNLSRNG